ncbi:MULTISPECIES: hypothetical protein [unclassified Pseudoalteromonas]|uniref:hypothetical protein n=1 Tax=unclassified Pseudoalteromonas TaxID=194690 RepID=UPI0018FF0ECF|nr:MULTISPECIES: hypothetical protein [unclassified Pseudoalteromonas]MBS3797989.1 hypothetical protein [Pseudoalteromonas sp. BDTF-M6]
MVKFFFVKYLAFLVGCTLCFVLHAQFAVPVVLAASVTGLLGSFIPLSQAFGPHPRGAVYAGSFAGMCSAELIGSYWHIALLALIGTSLYALTINMFTGFGGKLGGVAFVSVALFMLTRGGLW